MVAGISYRKANLRKIIEWLEYDYEFDRYEDNRYLTPIKSEYYTRNVVLEREPENEFDKNAIKVLVGKTHLGYVPKKIARKMAKLLDANINYIADLSLEEDYTGNLNTATVNIILYSSKTLPDIPPEKILNLSGEIISLKKEEIEIPNVETVSIDDLNKDIEEKNKTELQMANIGCLLIIFICVIVIFYVIFNIFNSIGWLLLLLLLAIFISIFNL